jgi:glycosyltransferase involved in cell wall biosynthesis
MKHYTEMKVSIITTYKNRPHHIIETLPTWINQDTNIPYEIIIVDYNTSEQLHDLLVVQSTKVNIKHIRCERLPIFQLSHARNIGANQASGSVLFFVDIDTRLRPNAVEYIYAVDNDHYMAAVDSDVRKDIINGGLIAVQSRFHHAIFGFNENLVGWGFEDIDYKLRLEKLGLSFQSIEFGYYDCIDHDDKQRTQCYSEEKEISWTRNRQTALRIWDNRDYGQWNFMSTIIYGDNHA